MAAIPAGSDESLDAMTGDELRAHSVQHGVVLDDWLADPASLSLSDLPREDVEASRRNPRLQAKHPVTEGKNHYLASAKACPRCETVPESLNWFYFGSPKETWSMQCGVAGWLAICDNCHLHVNFFPEAMS
jgi:hypothetical protein